MITAKHYGAMILLPGFIVLLSATALAVIAYQGWQLTEQDRELESRRKNSQLASAGALLSGELERGLAEWERHLQVAAEGASVLLPPDTVLLVLDSRGVVRHQGTRLPHFPKVSAAPEASAEVFAAAEVQEIGQGDLSGAAESYRRLASSEDPSVRAGALLRLARCLSNEGKLKEALSVYKELAALEGTRVVGAPAALVAARARAALFHRTGDPMASARERAALAEALWRGQFAVDSVTFEEYSLAIPNWPATDNRFRLAEAVGDLWERWREQTSGRSSLSVDGLAVVSVWRRNSKGTTAIVGSVDSLMASTSTQNLTANLFAAASFVDRDGRRVWGALPDVNAGAVTEVRAAGLPWTLQVALTDPAGTNEENAIHRRNLLAAGLVLLLLVIGAGSYLVLRTVNRELEVARLQSDFVAAVSHEFRSPLTVMRHLTDMLEEGETPAERVPLYYQTLGREARRLQGLVERLLDFGRMEAGRRAYRMEDAAADELAQRVVEEFRERAKSTAHSLTLQGTPEPLPVRVDRDAVALALGNLLDNALKYSPASSTVKVSVERKNGFAGISVEDQGPGIPKDEQRSVFRKFARGAAARSLNVAGTGIGLTIVDRIVKAHGGRVELASTTGEGSRFTILLPVTDRS
jgi:signal transduction histidine kinase